MTSIVKASSTGSINEIKAAPVGTAFAYIIVSDPFYLGRPNAKKSSPG